jgi:hypothetical protein
MTLKLPRLAGLLLVSLVLFIACQATQAQLPGSLIAVSLYKLHMASLAGWTGYWIDRLTFPYARPHDLLEGAEKAVDTGIPAGVGDGGATLASIGFSYGAEQAMLRRSIIVAACVVGICLGA